jgi:hypothetical protein
MDRYGVYVQIRAGIKKLPVPASPMTGIEKAGRISERPDLAGCSGSANACCRPNPVIQGVEMIAPKRTFAPLAFGGARHLRIARELRDLFSAIV